jgi:hypothetical protein
MVQSGLTIELLIKVQFLMVATGYSHLIKWKKKSFLNFLKKRDFVGEFVRGLLIDGTERSFVVGASQIKQRAT